MYIKTLGSCQIAKQAFLEKSLLNINSINIISHFWQWQSVNLVTVVTEHEQ